MKNIIFVVTIFTFVTYTLFIVYQQEKILDEGQVVILKTAPVDPRDMFRGEYVILRYEIEQEAYDNLSVYQKPLDRGKVYVSLNKDYRGVAYVERTMTYDYDLRPNSLYIKGEIKNDRVRFADLEQYYVTEGLGSKIEEIPAGKLFVEIRIKDGNARVVRLLDDNLEPIELSL
ncbi:GDYXXLXY domain-containing protein [Candidatus Kaiserbacteria bacterium]|nr:GDYXXLXY domain-containing protein [Candidatus Kaiserbacteria bacterium]